ncbi:hypothetical protein KIH74_10285 [Kineosporia sp. J2-2]|uniref:Uncharacterized protein n=1 Tax=Kineosporia corallincola TaxID=2835133 RepID=A0ABS5TE03_9ACTN|nr:hypothetical protein [Kineosporia corallincola]MBT0769309.1 hypothetical protein [Kineosporia corallincola]
MDGAARLVSRAGTVPVRAGAAGLLAGAGQALHQDGDLARSRREHLSALILARAEGDARLTAEAALGLGGLWVHEHRTLSAAAEVRARQQEALAGLSLHDPRALRLRIRLAAEADYAAGEARNVIALVEQARAEGDPVALAEALSLAHHCLLGPAHGAQRRRLAARLIDVAAATGRRSDLIMGVLWHCVDLFLAADPNAGRNLSELRDLLAGKDHPAARFVQQAIETTLLVRAGRLADAERAAQECAETGVRAGDADAEGWYVHQMIAIRWFQGRVGELLPLVRATADSPTVGVLDGSHFAALAVAAAGAGDRVLTAGALARLGDPEDLPDNSTRLLTLHHAIRAGQWVDDCDLVARCAAELTPHARLPVMASLAVACFGSASDVLGAAALHAQDADRAIDHLHDAVCDNLALGHRPALALTRWRLAAALEARGRPYDLYEAGVHRERATALADELGIPLPADNLAGAPLGMPARTVKYRRKGRFWRLELGEAVVEVENSVGMAHLAVLFDNPGRPVPAVRLAGAAPEEAGQTVLDPQAREQYRRRLAELDTQIARATDAARTAEADRARDEREWLIAELAAATGLGGRPREFAGAAERARTAVAKAIRRALDRIEAQHAELGGRLRREVRTGTSCCYQPGSR